MTAHALRPARPWSLPRSRDAVRTTTHAAMVVLCAAFVLLAAGFARLVPPFEAPDEGAHFGYIAYLHGSPGVPRLDAAVCAASHELVQQPPLYYAVAAAMLAGRPVTPTVDLYVRNPHFGQHGYRVTATPPGDHAADLRPLRAARLLSLVGGLVAVLSTWWIGRLLWPRAPAVALGGAAVVALNPQFLAAAGSVTNDAWAAAAFGVTVATALQATRRRAGARWWALVGAAAGLAALVKYSDLVVLVVVGAILVAHGRRRGVRDAVAAGAASAAAFVAVAGWWFAVQAHRYGSPLPLRRTLELLPDLARDDPASARTLLRELRWLAHSYWGVFGHGLVAPEPYFRLAWILSAAALVGLAVLLVRDARRRRQAGPTAVGLLALWAALVLAALLSWMRIVSLADQGRLLFPAAPAVGLLTAAGWVGLAPARLRSAAVAAGVACMTVLPVWALLVVAGGYGTPADLATPPRPDRGAEAAFEGGMRLVGLDLPAGAAVAGGGRLPLVLFLGADAEIPTFSVLFVHLTDDEDRRLGGVDVVPAGGRHPTRQWRPDAVFADAYDLQVAPVATDTLATLTVGFYDEETGRRRSVTDASGRPAGDRVVVGRVLVHRDAPASAAAGAGSTGARPDPRAETAAERAAGLEDGLVPSEARAELEHGPMPSEAPVELEDGLVLSEARVEPGVGPPRRVELAWSALRPVHADYAVSLQLLDRSGALLGQVDRPPSAPTSTWAPGWTVRDAFDLPAATGWDRLVLVLYDATGRRLKVEAPPAYAGQDSLVLRTARP